MEGVNWRDYIHSDPNVLVGKPAIKGTRISVELILEETEAGRSFDELIEAHPRLTYESIRAAIAFAREAVQRPSMQVLTGSPA